MYENSGGPKPQDIPALFICRVLRYFWSMSRISLTYPWTKSIDCTLQILSSDAPRQYQEYEDPPNRRTLVLGKADQTSIKVLLSSWPQGRASKPSGIGYRE